MNVRNFTIYTHEFIPNTYVVREYSDKHLIQR